MKLLKQLAKPDRLVIDYWGIAVVGHANRLTSKGDSLRKKD